MQKAQKNKKFSLPTQSHMSTYKTYLRALNDKYGYRATWSPGTPLKIGDVGVINRDGVFNPVGTLESMGITGVQVRPGSTLESINFNSSSGVSIALKASGQAAPAGSHLTEAEAGFSISFSKESAIVLRASDPKEEIILTGSISEQILEKYANGEWDKDHVVITSLVTAQATTVIISGESGGQIDISASGKSTVTDSDLANADGSLDVKWSNKISEQIIGKSGLTPLYRVHGVEKRWFKNGKFLSKDAKDVKNPAEEGYEMKHILDHLQFVEED